MENNKLNYGKLLPVLFAFFAMGFVDLVGIATNYVKVDFNLSDTMANMFPSMVFFWFLIFSVPTGVMMNKIGRRNTVLVSLVVTAISLIIPVFDFAYTFWGMLLSFSLLGIGNAIMQVSLNPLVSNIVTGKQLASTLTFGQFVKAIASFIAPIIAAWAATTFGDWKILFPIFATISIIAVLLLGVTSIQESKGETTSFGQCFSLLGNKFVLLSFIGIMCHVGIDVGTNVTAPKILMERLGESLETAGFATSVYFLFRTIGCFSGTFILAKVSARMFFVIGVVCMILGMGGLTFAANQSLIYVCVALMGFGNSNIFPIIFSQAMLHLPDSKNAVSGLMIMGLFGGTVFPLLMGLATDSIGSQIGAVIVMLVGILYLLAFSSKIKTEC
ncbi:MAG: MFS transporter [Muribaculaceae bacterium]|nr:MFS transporter [Muribaculaceae bacterium]MDY5118768.1 MFS transporter [Muribaculaceae bacterium]